MLKLYARIQLTADPDQRQEIEADGVDYGAAKAALEAQMRGGWRMLGISRWPSGC